MSPEVSGPSSPPTIELEPLPIVDSSTVQESRAQWDPPNEWDIVQPQDDQPYDLAETLPDPSTAVGVVEHWNRPRINILRTLATCLGFMIMGANDAAYGVSVSLGSLQVVLT